MRGRTWNLVCRGSFGCSFIWTGQTWFLGTFTNPQFYLGPVPMISKCDFELEIFLMVFVKIRSWRKFGFGEKDLFDQKVSEEQKTNRRRTSEGQNKNIRKEQLLSLFELTVIHYFYTGWIRPQFWKYGLIITFYYLKLGPLAEKNYGSQLPQTLVLTVQLGLWNIPYNKRYIRFLKKKIVAISGWKSHPSLDAAWIGLGCVWFSGIAWRTWYRNGS